MRKKMLLLALLLASAAGLSNPRADAANTVACPRCTTNPDGSVCCVNCVCDETGEVVACSNIFCP